MSALPRKPWTVEEYLAFERSSEERHEFIDGDIYMMSGASRNHNLIVFNVSGIFRSQLKGKPCEAYISDMRVGVPKGNYLYPDVVVVCGTPTFADKNVDTLLNPTLIIEVLSESTERYDRGKKFTDYRTLQSLQEYILIAQDKAYFERYVRQDDAWLLREVRGLDATLELSAIGCTLALAEVYDKVTFTEMT
ncbi:MAG: Uma2 family endonuclease [Anaerolineae bacterium]|nr:Uma2 family endonuclease [Anaerolineae bacterium]